MFDDLAALFYHNVVMAYDTYATCRSRSTSGRSQLLREAIEAATAIFHFREHVPAEHRKTRSEVVADCRDYRLIADVVNAAKHRTLTRDTSEGPPLVNSAEDIEEVTIITRYEDAEGDYSDARTVIMVKCTDGVRRNLDSALTKVVNYWGGELKRLGIVDYSPRDLPEPPGARFLPRAEARALDFELMRDLRFKHSLQLMKFDVSKGCSVPIDLTGASVRMRIYKPAYSVDVAMTPPDGGEELRLSLDLTEEQSAAFHKLTTDAEREALMRSILLERRDEVNQAAAQMLQGPERV